MRPMKRFSRRPFLRPLLVVAGLSLGALATAATAADEFDERRDNVFFREPDNATARRIETLIGTMSAGSPTDRAAHRRELTQIGYWAVNPLRKALREMDAPVQCASILTLENIGDPRAIDTLHEAVVQRDAHPYVAGFATLALGRFRHARSVKALRDSLDSPKSMELLRAAVPLAAARVRTPEAAELVAEVLNSRKSQRRGVRAARLLALGFFPSLALAEGGPSPSVELAAALSDPKYDVREAAVLAYLVASHGRDDTKSRLMTMVDPDARYNVQQAILTGLSAHAGPDVTEILAETAAGDGPQAVRETAAELLIGRGDLAALPSLRRLLRKRTTGRLRGATVLALASIDDALARRLVLSELGASEDLVRAAVGVAATLFPEGEDRARALAQIDSRLKGPGEPDKVVRANLKLARGVLAGERTTVRWQSIQESDLFDALDLSYDDRLLRLVNLRVEASLDLQKITNLEADIEDASLADTSGNRGSEAAAPEADESETDDDSVEDVDLTDNPRNNETPDVLPGPPSDSGPGAGVGSVPGRPRGGKSTGADGVVRTNQWQELRDLKIELKEDPYFGPDDLPGNRRSAPTAR